MSSASNQPSNLPAGNPAAGDTQLGVLLDAAQDMLAEEIRRTDRLESRARHMSTTIGALFAVGMATTAAVLNALLPSDTSKGTGLADWVIPTVGGLALTSAVCTGIVGA